MNMIKGKMNYWEGRGKVFDFLAPDIRGYERVNENRWFEMHQPLLLKMLNCQTGRDFFGIAHDAPLIIEIRKNVIKYALETKMTLKGLQILKVGADFRVGAKWANYIRLHWLDFIELAECFNWQSQLGFSGLGLLARVKGECVMASGRRLYDTLTAYPDPHPETNTNDARVYRTQDNDTWSDLVTGAGTGVFEDGTPILCNWILDSAGTCPSNWFAITRALTLFDTSSLPDDATISSATASIYGISSQIDYVAWETEFYLAPYAVAPASNTATVAADYGTFGTTTFATAKIYGDLVLSAYNDFTLNATGLAAISKTGITKIGWRSTADVADSAPTCTSTPGSDKYAVWRFGAAEATGTTNDPKLVVTYTLASGDTGGMFLVF